MTDGCDRAGCRGAIAVTGFCDTCGRPPPAVPIRSRLPRHRAESWTDLPVYRVPRPEERLLRDPALPGGEQRCGNCGWPIGRGFRGQDGLVEGFCGHCGRRFSFRPKLVADDVIADRYVIDGCFAGGGLGWVYLARDTHLDDSRVVLKGVKNDADAMHVAAAVRERQALRELDHPGIVRIFDAVTGPVPGSTEQTAYIVMAYVHGLTLREVIDHPGEPLDGPLRVEHAVNCGLEILAALDYLHDRELLYCDMKPENVMLTGGGDGRDEVRIKLVDLGATRRMDDRSSPMITTRGHGPPEPEPASVRLDLYLVGTTLRLLAEAAVDSDHSDPEPLGVTSFRLVVDRARHADPARRFGSAAEMAEQLRGVRRELAALRTGRPVPAPSPLFAPTATLLDAGLGTPPELGRWTGAIATPPAGPPAPARVAVDLPAPRVDPGDPAADLLALISAPDARRLVEKLAALPTSPAVEELSCRAQVELGDLEEARACLERAIAAGEPAGGWRVAWHQGLIELAAGEVTAAEARFSTVRAILPGESAPELALGCTAEQWADHERAERYYASVWGRDRAEADAVFGSARIALVRGDRAQAVRVLDEVPQVSRHADAARIAAVRACCVTLPGEAGLPTADDLAEAERRLPDLYLDARSRDRLAASLTEAALAGVRAGVDRPDTVLGVPADERHLRRALETALRGLAQQAGTAEEHGTLVDRANSVRPRTWW